MATAHNQKKDPAAPESPAAGGPRVLRIGVILGGKIVEERLVRKRETITVGQSPKSSIVIPVSDLPASFPVFELKGQNYQLNFTGKMDGRLSVGDRQLDFTELKAEGLARPEQDYFSAPLTEQSKGKLTLGEVTLLFQFVVPPAVATRATIPDELRGSFLQGIDRLFFGIMAAVLIFNFGSMKVISLREIPPEEELTLEDLPDRFAKLIIPEKRVEQPKAVEVAEAGGEEKREEAKPRTDDKPRSEVDAKPRGSPERRAEVAAGVAQKGLLKILGAAGGGAGGSIEDVLGAGAGASDIASALAGAGGVGVASADELAAAGGRKGGGTGEATGIGDLGTSGGAGGAGSLGEKKAVQITGRVVDQAPEVDSASCDRDAIARYVKRNLKAVQACYERELKRNTGLKGKIVVRFTIGATGRVSEIEIEESTLGNDSVSSCIRNTIRLWMFPIKDNECPVSYPFVFSPAS